MYKYFLIFSMIYFSLENKFTTGNSHFASDKVTFPSYISKEKHSQGLYQSEVTCSLNSSSCCTTYRYNKLFIIKIKTFSFL